jgi:tetratricopeptide (TPR) repeat protein
MMKKSLFLVLSVFFAAYIYAQDANQLIKLAQDSVQAGKFAGAFLLYEKAMANPGDVKVKPSINFEIATTAIQAGKNEAALTYLDKAIEAGVDTSNHINLVKCYQYKAQVYNKLKNLPNSLECYEKALEISTDKPGTLMFNAATLAFNLEKYEKAVGYFDQAFQSGYKPEDALVNKAMVYKKMNNDSAYMLTLLLGNEKFPANKKFSGTLAGIYVTDGNKLYKGGLDILNAANKKINEKKLKPEDADYKNAIAKVNAEYAKAVEVLKKALVLDPANANAQKLIDACKPVK